MPVVATLACTVLSFTWLRMALAPMVVAVARAARDPRRSWAAPLFALAPVVVWTAIGAAAVMIALTGIPSLADAIGAGSYRTGLGTGVAAWLVAVWLRAPAPRWLELEWPLARDVRGSVYARYVPADPPSAHATGAIGKLIRAASALTFLSLT